MVATRTIGTVRDFECSLIAVVERDFSYCSVRGGILGVSSDTLWYIEHLCNKLRCSRNHKLQYSGPWNRVLDRTVVRIFDLRAVSFMTFRIHDIMMKHILSLYHYGYRNRWFIDCTTLVLTWPIRHNSHDVTFIQGTHNRQGPATHAPGLTNTRYV